MNNLFSPEGVEVPVGSPAEATRLKARGYTEQAPTVIGAEHFDPSQHNVPDVLDYVEAHPERADAVVSAEKAGKNRASITGA